MEEKVLSILKNVLEIECDDKLVSKATCGVWDSLKTLNIMIELESEFGICFEPEDLERMDGFNSICELLRKKGLKN